MAPTETVTIALTELPPGDSLESGMPSPPGGPLDSPSGLATPPGDITPGGPRREFTVDQFHGLTRTRRVLILGLIMSVNLVQVRCGRECIRKREKNRSLVTPFKRQPAEANVFRPPASSFPISCPWAQGSHSASCSVVNQGRDRPTGWQRHTRKYIVQEDTREDLAAED